MRISNLLFVIAVCATAGSYSRGAEAANEAIRLSSVAQVEREVVGKDGKKTLKRVPVGNAVPTTEVIYTTTFANVVERPVGDIVIDNPIPNNSEYKAGSAFGLNSEILFSVDGGKSFATAERLKVNAADGRERTALPKEYTHIRWRYREQLAVGKTGEVGFRTTIK